MDYHQTPNANDVFKHTVLPQKYNQHLWKSEKAKVTKEQREENKHTDGTVL